MLSTDIVNLVIIALLWRMELLWIENFKCKLFCPPNFYRTFLGKSGNTQEQTWKYL